jgi:hypothetical protein
LPKNKDKLSYNDVYQRWAKIYLFYFSFENTLE